MSNVIYFHESVDVDAILEDLNLVELSCGEYCERDETVKLTNGERRHCDDDDIAECQYCDDWHDIDDCDSVCTEDGRQYCCGDCAENDDYHLHSDGCWYPEPECQLRYSADVQIDVADSNELLIGFEVEKEDDRFEGEWHGHIPDSWDVVSDGSLDCDGFEIVTRAYNVDRFDADFRNDVRRSSNILDAYTSSSCGGHINISKRGLTGPEMFDRYSASFALYMAMWPTRMSNGYVCESNGDADDCKSGGKYNPIRIGYDRIEIRIPNRVNSAACLLRRYELTKWLFQFDGSPDEQRRRIVSFIVDGGFGELFKHYSHSSLDSIGWAYVAFDKWFHGQGGFTRSQVIDGARSNVGLCALINSGLLKQPYV